MAGIIEFLKGIADFFTSIVKFLINFLKDLVFVVKALAETIINIPNYIGFLPTAIVSLFAMALSVVIIYKVMGRD